MPKDVLEPIHIIIAIGSLAVMALLAYISSKTKNAILETKVEIVGSVNKVSNALEVHVKTDDIRHDDFDTRITTLEHRRHK